MSDLTIVKSDSWKTTIQIKSNGLALDITGYKIYFTVKKNKSIDDSKAVIKKDITSHDNASGGVTSISLTYDETNIPIGQYYYDIQIKTNDSKIYTPLIGVLNIVADVTTRTT